MNTSDTLTAATTMNKPNATTDRRYEELSVELETVNSQIHQLRLKARKLNEEFLAMKAASEKPNPSPPKPAPKKSTSTVKPKSPKPQAPEDDLMLGGVSD